MPGLPRAILTHGGAGSNPLNSDGPQAAAAIGLEAMRYGETALSAVVRAVRHLESDPRFNAGVGSHLRADGATIQMDAACMVSSGEFGAVACVEHIANPIELAREVLDSAAAILLVGEGAHQFALERQLQLEPLGDSRQDRLAAVEPPPSCDTVGAVAFDGTTFAAALSTGGRRRALLGRIGDVPMVGCGLFCGPAGAVACTGQGEEIAKKVMAREVYGWLARGMAAGEAAERALGLLDPAIDVGLIVLTDREGAARSRNGMAWARLPG